MKKRANILIPMIFISIVLILLTGCFGTIPDESPGYTPGSIKGIIAAPCCSTSGDPVTEPQGAYPNFWCDLCQKPSSWYLQDGVEVVLTYGEDEIATTTTNNKGEFTFNNVEPGKNYVITAYCPDFNDERPLVKDVALEVVAGSSYDTKITDLVSTSLGLVVDFIVTYSELTPEDIVLDEVVGDRPNFTHFPKFRKLVTEVRRVLERDCGNLNTDDNVQDALCRAAEEITGLDFGCGPGYTPYTPPYNPPTDPCDGNQAPSISIADKTINAGDSLSYKPGDSGYSASDDNTNGAPSFSLSNAPSGMTINSSTGEITFNTACGDGAVHEDIEVTITDACGLTASDTFTLTVEECSCCKFDFFSGGGTQRAKWTSDGVKVQYQLKKVCSHENIDLKVEVYYKDFGTWKLYGTDSTSFTFLSPNPSGNITTGGEWEQTNIARPTWYWWMYEWKFKFTITESNGYCPGYSKTKEGNFSN